MLDYKNSVVREKTNWLGMIIVGGCFIGSIAMAGFLYLLMAV
jgi:hypothetical protein